MYWCGGGGVVDVKNTKEICEYLVNLSLCNDTWVEKGKRKIRCFRKFCIIVEVEDGEGIG